MSNLAAAGNGIKKHIRTFTYMIGLIVAIVVFNILGYVFNKELEKGQVAHVWCFTTAFLVVVDLYIDVKYHAYWYFTKGVDWASLPAALLLIPPVNIIFINWYPWNSKITTYIKYFVKWEMVLLSYELITLLPKPWGYFHYGWWNLFYSALLNPLLLLTLITYYKHFIRKED